jgi:hypothetical protein
MNDEPKMMDEMRYAVFLTELVGISLAMCSALLQPSDMKVLTARGAKFIVDTATRRRVSQ